eukprot:scaffold36089_cov59-Phaeocystis_antarctica.AAC.1
MKLSRSSWKLASSLRVRSALARLQPDGDTAFGSAPATSRRIASWAFGFGDIDARNSMLAVVPPCMSTQPLGSNPAASREATLFRSSFSNTADASSRLRASSVFPRCTRS